VPVTERDFAISVVKQLQEAGYQALWAGGCVRDELLDLCPKDYDVATDAKPEDVQRLFRRTVEVGMSFGVVQVLGPRPFKVEVATFRSDVSYSDGRHPDAVVFASAREDVLRRDFTINGMFYDPIKKELVDYVGGQEDLRARVLRAIGEPRVRFNEDKLRLLRAARFATRFDLTIDPATAQAVKEMAPEITVVSAERIAQELRHLLVHPRRAHGLNLLDELELVGPILPELLPMKGLPQGLPGAPSGDLWHHVMQVMDRLGPEPSFPLALAALLHDVGKPRTVGRTPDRYTFYYHEHVGARIANDIALRLRLSNDERERIVWLVEKHQILADARHMRTAKLKQLLIHPGIHELLALHRADALAWGRKAEHVDYCEFLLREWTDDDLNPAAVVTGHDLMKEFKLEPGPLYKEILEAVREAQLDGTIKTKTDALAFIEKLLREKQ
jgi:poly(A) polymerase